MTHRDPYGGRTKLDGLTKIFLAIGFIIVACILGLAVWQLERIFNFVH